MPAGNEYRWDDPGVPVAEPPEWLVQRLLTEKPGKAAAGAGVPVPEVIPAGQRNSELFSIPGRFRRFGCSYGEILAVLREANKRCRPPVDEAELEGIAAGIMRYEPGRSYALTEFGLAERLRDDLAGSAAWCPELGFLLYDGRRWAEDHDLGLERRAQQVIKELEAEGESLPEIETKEAFLRFAHRSQSARTVQAVQELLRQQVTRGAGDFDRDPYLFNVGNGTLDLRTGKLRPHHRDDLIRKIAPIDHDPDAPCPTFERFLGEIMGHDGAMVGYLRRLFGYAMLGVPKQELAVFHGTGRNGKSTLLTLMREVFGDYARQTGAEIVMERRNEGIPNDIARLAGARLVTASETRDGNRLNAARIKSLLGGEPVTARYLHKEFFEFLPQLLLVLGTNHKPIIDGADFGLMRRLQLVPFEVVIPPERVDPHLMRVGAWRLVEELCTL